MGHIKFKLEDGNGLACHYIDDTNFVEFEYQAEGAEPVIFKLHKIQMIALLKAVNTPLKLGLELKR